VHQVGNQSGLYYDAQSTNHQHLMQYISQHAIKRKQKWQIVPSSAVQKTYFNGYLHVKMVVILSRLPHHGTISNSYWLCKHFMLLYFNITVPEFIEIRVRFCPIRLQKSGGSNKTYQFWSATPCIFQWAADNQFSC